jgi:RecB family exonuclease
MARLRVVTSTSAEARLDAARAFVGALGRAREIVIVGASRGAADEVARDVGVAEGATFGLRPVSLLQLASRIAATAGGSRVPSTQSGAEACAARAAFDARQAGDLTYFGPVAHMPGFPRALARTIHELRLAGVAPGRVEATSGDIARLLARVESEFERAGVSDRADLLTRAATACKTGTAPWVGRPIVLLDVPLDSPAERELIAALVARAPDALALVPAGDEAVLEWLTGLAAAVERLADPAPAATDLAHLRRFVFSSERPSARSPTGDVALFSAPGEGREAIEIVRYALDEAARGVRFDEMAVLLRSPEPYVGLLEHACARAGIPVFFDRGTRRPDPSGRAFIALLSCAVEGLSARRFDEYLSLGQVPAPGRGGAPPAVDDERLRPSRGEDKEIRGEGSASVPGGGGAPPAVDDERLRSSRGEDKEIRAEGSASVPGGGGAPPAVSEDDTPDSDDDAVIAGTLRSPWKWEELIVESAVVGGRDRADGQARWRRRLDGLAAEYRYRLEELGREDPDSPRLSGLARDVRNLAHLRAFALPLVDMLGAWPERATWGEWLERFREIALQALRTPERVLGVLTELAPMAAVGPVGLDEARDVLHARLTSLDWEPPARRYGRLFVGTPHQARGRAFRVVFVPGLAERIVPQRPREDPLLLDERRRHLGAPLVGQPERGQAERLLLRIAIGAARERVYLSYPRMDVGETRPRVPSFYALDVVRAITGEIPDHRVLAADAAEAAGARLSWPAPVDPRRAIDDLEHDLASIRPLLDSRDPAAARGRAHYLLDLNDALRRSVISRWTRYRASWSASDGLVSVEGIAAPALKANRLGARPYSLSALQRFAACPYQFLLSTIHRLEPREDPAPLIRLDPLTRGSLFHRVQAEFYRRLQAERRLPVTPDGLADAARTLDEELDRVAAEYAEQLAPAIPRIWRDEISDLRRDLGIWVRRIADERTWHPEYFEFSFGLHDAGRDPRSLPEPVQVGGRFTLRGSVDLIERRADLGVVRVTDHKTGKNRTTSALIVGGGQTLQPVLYGLAVEAALGVRVTEGRLFYCTTAGGFTQHAISLSDPVRERGLEVLAIIDRAIEQGFLVAAPHEGACDWCDFRPVCGPREEERVQRKLRDRLADLQALRDMP